MLNFGVIGYGYWGPNIVRNLNDIDSTKVAMICDKSPKNLQRAIRTYPHTTVTTDASKIFTSSEIDAVAVITPVGTHFELAKQALSNGKHLFVEKPFTATSQQAEELIELAEKHDRILMVDHTFLFTGAVRKIRQLMDENALGKLRYYDSTRVNLGMFQHDVDVLWDLAPHDLSIVDYLIGGTPEAVVATGAPHLNGRAYIAFLTLYYPDNVIAHLNVNWLSPVKVRTTLIGGEKQMVVWNDLEADEKIKVYNKGIDIADPQNVYDLLVSYRSGDMWSPKVNSTEALKTELEYFVDCVMNMTKPFNDGMAGLRVVKILEAAQDSLNRSRREVTV